METTTTTSELIIELSKITLGETKNESGETKSEVEEPTIHSNQGPSRINRMCTSFLRMIGYYPGCSKWNYLLLLLGSIMTGYSVYSTCEEGFNKLIDNVTPADQLATKFQLYRILSMTSSIVVASIVALSALNEMGKDLRDLERFFARRNTIGKDLAKLETDISELKRSVQIFLGMVPSETTALAVPAEQKRQCPNFLITFGFYPGLTRYHYVLLFLLSTLATYQTFVSTEKGVNDVFDYLVTNNKMDNNVELFNTLDKTFASIVACFTLIFSFKSVSKGIYSLEEGDKQNSLNANKLVSLQQDLAGIKQTLHTQAEELEAGISPVLNFIDTLFLQADFELEESKEIPNSQTEDVEPTLESKSMYSRVFSKCGASHLSWRSHLFFLVGTITATYETFDSADEAILAGSELINDAVDYLKSSAELNRNHELLRTISLIMSSLVTLYIMMWTLKLVCKGLNTLKQDSPLLDYHGKEVIKLRAEVDVIKQKTSVETPFYSRIFNLFGVASTGVALYDERNQLTRPVITPSIGMTLSASSRD